MPAATNLKTWHVARGAIVFEAALWALRTCLYIRYCVPLRPHDQYAQARATNSPELLILLGIVVSVAANTALIWVIRMAFRTASDDEKVFRVALSLGCGTALIGLPVVASMAFTHDNLSGPAFAIMLLGPSLFALVDHARLAMHRAGD